MIGISPTDERVDLGERVMHSFGFARCPVAVCGRIGVCEEDRCSDRRR